MFDTPIAFQNKRMRAARKLRYEYCNILYHKYNQRPETIVHGLPTPESSAAEASEGEEASQKRRRRIRKRWKTVIGDSYSDCDTDDDYYEGHDEEHREEDEERIFLRKYDKPQYSFEKWQTDAKKRKPIQRNKISFSKVNRIQKYSLRNMEKSLAFASQKNRNYFNTISQGLEYIDRQFENTDNFHIKHVTILTTLLQLHVSRHNWNLAYKCFTLLIRMPKVDIRNLWGIGERILAEKEPSKSLEFLEWMNSIYSSRITFCEDINYQSAPVFTKGSKNHVPKYTITFLWESLINCTKDMEEVTESEDYNERDLLQELIEKISELVLGPPYMEESEIWFIYSLCHMVKADKLSRQFNQNLMGSARDIASNRVFQHIQNSKTLLQTCASKEDFHFPRRYIERQLESFEKRLQKQVDNQNLGQENSEMYNDLDSHLSRSEDNLTDGITSSDDAEHI